MFGTVDIKTRPLRLAYLVEPNSATQVREAIRLSCSLWGGAYFPIIPLYKRMPATWREKPFRKTLASDVILGYLRAFDPDILVQFSRDLPNLITETKLRIIRPDEVWASLDDPRNLTPRFGIGIFEIFDDIFDKHFRYLSKYPIRVILPTIPQALSLFWTSLLGELPSKVIPLLEEHFSVPLEIETLNFSVDKLREIIANNVLFPRRIAEYGLTHHRHSPRTRGGASLLFLDARKVGDIVDYWNLRALGGPVLPVPKQLRSDPQLQGLVVQFLKDHRRLRQHDPASSDFAHLIRARNCTPKEMKEYAQTLKIDRDPDDPSIDPFFALQHWYPRIWDESVTRNDAAMPDDIYGPDEESLEARELEVRSKALLPKFAYRQSYHSEPRCANEFGFRFFGADQHLAEVFPKASGRNLIRAISGMTSFGKWRIGRNGLVKLVEYTFTETRSVPTAESVFFAWLSDLGWKAQLSPPGLLAKEIYKTLRGNPVILKNKTFLDLLERMNGGKIGREITALKVEPERVLSVGAVKSRLEGSSEGDNPHDYLIGIGVFKLGIRVQCPNCLRNSWFPLDRLRDRLTCPKCLNSFPTIGNISSPDWSYKTAGPFSIPRYAEGAYTVLLTLECIAGHRVPTIRTTPVMSFKAKAPGKEELEADIAMLWQESVFGETIDGLLVGECKSYGLFEQKDFDRMRYVARTFPGSVLVFSTLRTELVREEISGIRRIAKTGRKYWKSERPINPVLILTGTELLSLTPPPYCWRETLQERFSGVHTLLDICDATQQIYLGLSSWRTEWHEQWEEKHRRQQTKRTGEKSNNT